METIQQPKISGYRKLSEAEVALMNEAKALGEQCGALVAKLRAMPRTPDTPKDFDPATAEVSDVVTIDQRWVSIGQTDLQTGIMALVRSIAQPTTF